MKKLIVCLIVCFVIVGLFAAPAMAAPPLHKASGGGFYPHMYTSPKVAFTAVQTDEAGDAYGEFTFINAWDEGFETYHCKVLYLLVDEDTGKAWISGLITSSSVEEFVGDGFGYAIQDNGNGNAANPDKVSGFYIDLDTDWAKNMYDFAVFPLTYGNINVK